MEAVDFALCYVERLICENADLRTPANVLDAIKIKPINQSINQSIEKKNV